MRGRTLFMIVCISLVFGAVAAFALFEALHRPGGPGDASPVRRFGVWGRAEDKP